MISKQNNTESLLTKGCFIDEMQTIEALNYLLEDQLCVFTAIKESLPNIDKIVELMYQHLNLAT